MKRFLKTLCLIALMTTGASPAMAQNSHDEIIQKFLEQRKRMMEDIMKAFDDDEFFKDDFFKDDMFESLRQHGLGAFKGFYGGGNNISVEEKMEKDGSITVTITPKNKDINLDIVTGEDRITIKSETKVEEESEQGQAKSKSISMRSFTRTVAIPEGYSAKTPKQDGDSIVISLVPKEGNILKPNKDGRVPVKKRAGEQTI